MSKELSESDKRRIYECIITGTNNTTIEQFAERMKEDWNERAAKDPFFYITGAADVSEDWMRHWGKEDVEKHFTPRFNKYYTEKVPTILELGAGIGRMSEHIAKYCDRLIACDISSEFLSVAKARLDSFGVNNVDFVEISGYSLERVADDSVDLMFEYIVFQHIGSFEVIKAYLKDISRVLKSGGYFIMHARANDFNADNALNINNTFHGCNVTYNMMLDTVKEQGNLEIIEHDIYNNDYWGILKKK